MERLPPVSLADDAIANAGRNRETTDGSPLAIGSHADVLRIATSPELFSNAVSRHLQIPNGLDGAEHFRFRALIDRYFTPENLADFAPTCRRVARGLVATLPGDRDFDAVRELGLPFAVRAQSAWLGWPVDLERPLLDWLEEKLSATRSGEATRLAELAARFDEIVGSLIAARRGSDGSRDVSDRLVHDESAGRPLSDVEIVSILRNWTGGDLGTMALAAGVVVHFLATHPRVADRLRVEAADDRIDAAVDEMLRRDDPFVASRRVATGTFEIAGACFGAGQRLVLDWASANRDPHVFDPPDAYEPERNADSNLVYGVGPHVCPGRALARLELRELTRALLDGASEITLVCPPLRELHPLGGYRSVVVRRVAG